MTRESRDALIALLIESRDMDYPASLYKFTPERMADAILGSEWLRAHLAATGGAERGLRAAVEALVAEWESPRWTPKGTSVGMGASAVVYVEERHSDFYAEKLRAALDAAPTEDRGER